MKIKILEEAEQDLIDGFRFYEAQNFGLGQDFLDSLFSDIDSLQLFAGIHPMVFRLSTTPVQKVSIAIYYQVDNDIVRIRAVLDCRQDPKKIQDRLT